MGILGNRNLFKRISRRLRKRFLWKTVMLNVNDRPQDWPAALLHYVSDPFNDRGSEHDYVHTTDWEAIQLTKILDELGFRVDVVDRSEETWEPEDSYELLVSNAAGNSGRRYPEYCRLTPSALHVFYARGANTDMANKLSQVRYEALKERTGFEFEGATMRVMDKVDFPLSMSLTDAILTINGNGFTAESYETTGKSIASFTPPTSPRALIARDSMRNRDKSKFFCFAGNGFVRKGVDLVVEAFLDMPNLTLTLAGPSTDDLFWRIYGERIRSSPNIDFIGFIEAGGERYREICQSHAWSIMAAACEGVSTSVATTMRSGLLPVVTYETAVRTDDFGFLLPTDPSQIIKHLKELAPQLGTWDESDYETRVDACLIASEDYTEASYIRSVTDALSEILRSENVVKQ